MEALGTNRGVGSHFLIKSNKIGLDHIDSPEREYKVRAPGGVTAHILRFYRGAISALHSLKSLHSGL